MEQEQEFNEKYGSFWKKRKRKKKKKTPLLGQKYKENKVKKCIIINITNPKLGKKITDQKNFIM